jgi:hypothetical protein
MTTSEHRQQRNGVQVVLTDPWDLVTVAGTGAHKAVIIKSGRDQNGRPAVLLELEEPFTVSGDEYRFWTATARHDDAALLEMKRGTTVSSNLLRLPQNRAEGATPLDTSWWRGGAGAAIGDVTVL